jgi:hypothetical protein
MDQDLLLFLKVNTSDFPFENLIAIFHSTTDRFCSSSGK